jgi:glycosyltransferase involved in cell wall biosynthesis
MYLLKVLFQNRPDMFAHWSGDVVQLMQTKECLERLGINVDISLELRPNLDDYDLVHLFNLTRVHETFIQCLNAKRHKKPVVLSSIYWNTGEFMSKGSYVAFRPFPVRKFLTRFILPNEKLSGIFDNIKDFASRRKISEESKIQRKMGLRNQQERTLALADVVLPNSNVEAELLHKDFQVPREKMTVVPNAADCSFADAKKDLFVDLYGLEDFVLSVAHIYDRKNTLYLIKAAVQEKLPLVLIGDGRHSLFADYLSLCEKEARKGKVHFLGSLDHSSPLLESAYAAAKVHALVSWFETPGLSSLEAALMGCNIVTTNRGSAQEYFKHYAWYCDPSNIASISNAILKAYRSPKKTSLKFHILNNYTWDKVAKKTLDAYHRVIKSEML